MTKSLLGVLLVVVALGIGWWWTSRPSGGGAASSAATSPRGPLAGDADVRGVMQTLELPAMAVGDEFKVNYEFLFD